MTEDHQSDYLASLVDYLRLPVTTLNRPAILAELAALVPQLSVNPDNSRLLLEHGCPEHLKTYIDSDPAAFEQSLGSKCPMQHLGKGHKGRRGTLKAVRIISPHAFGDRQGLTDAILTLGAQHDDPELIEEMAGLLGITLDRIGLSFTRYAVWIEDKPRMRAWVETLFREADPSRSDWSTFIMRALETQHPVPLALLVSAGINPRRHARPMTYDASDWTSVFYETCGSNHGFLEMHARLPGFQELCTMEPRHAKALLTGAAEVHETQADRKTDR